MKHRRSKWILFVIGLAGHLTASIGSADILVDYNPSIGDRGGTWNNEYCTHYHGERVTFDDTVSIDGIDIYTEWASNAQGTYMVSIWLDDGNGEPGELWMRWEQAGTDVTEESHNNTTYYRHSADFPPIQLEPGQIYWISMAGNGWNLGQSTVWAPDDEWMAYFGCWSSGLTYVGDMSFRLRGTLGGLSLSTLGSCPGPMRFKVEGATISGRVAYLYARGEGSVEIPPGNPCAGTTLGLNATVQLVEVERADENGIARLDIDNVPNAACGRIYLQALDLESCATTNVVLIQ